MDNSQGRDRILNTVRNLARMANPENGAFPNEIATASAQMQRLMDQYNISMSEVLFEEQNSGGKHQEFENKASKGMIGTFKRWHWQLGRCIARITGTKYYATGGFGTTLRDPKKRTRGQHMTFFGLRQSCELAADLFDEWVVLIDDMGKEGTADYIKEMQSRPDVILLMHLYEVKQFRMSGHCEVPLRTSAISRPPPIPLLAAPTASATSHSARLLITLMYRHKLLHGW